jgi:hypothetical protein
LLSVRILDCFPEYGGLTKVEIAVNGEDLTINDLTTDGLTINVLTTNATTTNDHTTSVCGVGPVSRFNSQNSMLGGFRTNALRTLGGRRSVCHVNIHVVGGVEAAGMVDSHLMLHV